MAVCWKQLKQLQSLLCQLLPFLKGKSYFEMQTLSPTLKLGSLLSRCGLLWKTDKHWEFSFHNNLWYQVYRATLSKVQDYRLSQIIIRLASIVFHLTVKFLPTIAMHVQKKQLSSHSCRVKELSLSPVKFSKSSINVYTSINRNTLGSISL